MGGERASKTRMRLAGKICACCSHSLPAPYTGRETLCAKCETDRQPKRKIYMHFMLREGWHCQFLEADLKTPLPRKLNLKTPDDIRGMIERVGTAMTTEECQGFEYAITTGRGSVWLNLTEEQYRKLKVKASG